MRCLCVACLIALQGFRKIPSQRYAFTAIIVSTMVVTTLGMNGLGGGAALALTLALTLTLTSARPGEGGSALRARCSASKRMRPRRSTRLVTYWTKESWSSLASAARCGERRRTSAKDLKERRRL